MSDEIIFNGIFGSNLYGTANEDSDIDYKGVFMPSIENTILGQYKDSIETQNKDVDKSMYAVSKFIRMLEKADTVSIDMLHTPPDSILEISPLWEQLYRMRKLVYSKNMRGIIGYIKTQSSKYGHKVQRLQEMEDFLKNIDLAIRTFGENAPVSHLIDTNFSSYKHISYTPTKSEGGRDIIGNIDVCGSRYQINSSLGYMELGILKKVDRYGSRSKKGSVEGGDWKSLSHAYRVLTQLEEIIETRDLVFPLRNADEIKNIKFGVYNQDTVMEMIETKYDKVMKDLENSDLPEESDLQPMKDVVVAYFVSRIGK